MCVCRLGTLEQVGVMYFTIDNRVECGNAGKRCQSVRKYEYVVIFFYLPFSSL